MRKATILIVVALFVLALPSMAARVTVNPIPHPPFPVFQAYCGSTCEGVGNQVFAGLETGSDVIDAVPGVLAICPGGAEVGTPPEFVIDWENYVSDDHGAGVFHQTTNTTLRKTVPDYVCTVGIGGLPVLQQGTANIRRWWPLMYELPGTEFTLTITWKSVNSAGQVITWDDDGSGPNPAATTHQDVWKWSVDADFTSLANLIKLFHTLPVGSCQVPLIFGKDLYEDLLDDVEQLASMSPSDPEMSEEFAEFILELEDSCLPDACGVCGSGYGIRNTVENPACCKLLADAEFIAEKLSVYIPGK